MNRRLFIKSDEEHVIFKYTLKSLNMRLTTNFIASRNFMKFNVQF